MTKHTPEPWEIQHDTCAFCRQADRQEFVFNPGPSTGLHGAIVGRADAERIVACVNACAGINPEAIQDLLSFAVAMAENDSDECVRNAAREIVKKARPGWRPKP